MVEALNGPSGQARVRAAATATRRALSAAPSGLFLDIDGTLSRVGRHPAEATVSPAARRSLERLASSLDVVMAVTGRGVDDARALVGTDLIGYVGNHGLERANAGPPGLHPLAAPYVRRVDDVLHAVAVAAPIPGLVLENKGPSASIHYRLAPDPIAARLDLLAILEPILREVGLRVTEGKLVLNIVPAVGVDKGTAITEIVVERGLRGVVFLGDDVTDVDALRALRRLRDQRGVSTLGIGVWSPEGPPEIRQAADLLLHGVPEVERLLVALAARPPRPTADESRV